LPKILAIDDDESFLLSLANLLRYKNYDVEIIANSREALNRFLNQSFDCVLVDVKMPGMDGMTLLKEMLENKPHVPIILISGQSNIATAVEAMKLGAYDFIEKPLDPDRLLITLRNALERSAWIQERGTLLSQLGEAYQMVGESAAMQKLFQQIHQIAPLNTKVLILGESGTGKELVARALHYHSPRSGKPFVKINCAAIPGELLESELFGHVRGAFTGAIKEHKGKFLIADGGTLFLDEISEMDLRLQAKLLRVLQEGEVEVVGEPIPRRVDVRILAATNKNIKELVEEGKFREDLYYRLNVIQITIPPLRERKEDIAPLVQHFIRKFAQRHNKAVFEIAAPALRMLEQYPWPGNVRELENVVEKMVIFASTSRLEVPDVQKALEPSSPASEPRQPLPQDGTLEEALQKFEREFILSRLQQNNWQIQQTATELGIHRSALFKKMRKLGIQNPRKK
jgi:DNA-binding NtrC family response regulator